MAFETVLEEAIERVRMRVLCYCVMPNHWHMVLWPRNDGDLSAFVGWLTLTHTQRWHAHRRTAGSGHLYQGRFKSLVVQSDTHLLSVCRYVERNPLRAGLVERAEHWSWSSLGRRQFGDADVLGLLNEWPVPRPANWLEFVNRPVTQPELDTLRRNIARGQPYGEPGWARRVAARFGLPTTYRPRGRPRKTP